MKKIFIYLCLFAVSGFSIAQQNLFNIPSGDITPKNKFFYQHQFNFYNATTFESKSHLVYGLGSGWDIGLNLVDIPLRIGNGQMLSYNDNSNRKPLYPIAMMTAQKKWSFMNDFQLNVGVQVGANISNTIENKRMAFMNYALARWKPGKRGYLIGGAYLANDVFVGGPPALRPGYMLGYEFKINNRLLLMGDFISGTHKKSQMVLGGGVNLGKRLQLFTGALFAFPNQDLQNGLVVEVNWYGWNFNQVH